MASIRGLEKTAGIYSALLSLSKSEKVILMTCKLRQEMTACQMCPANILYLWDELFTHHLRPNNADYFAQLITLSI